MKTFLIFLCFFFFIGTLQAQTQKRCGTTEYYQKLFAKNPSLRLKFAENQRLLARNFDSRRNARLTQVEDTIALVVHVVGSTNMQQLVTDAIIQSQIDVLNEDYQGKNADSTRIPAAFKPLYGKSGMVFKLAGTNIYGEPTNGIVRIINNNTYNLGNTENAKTTSAGGSDAWDPSQYLNIWVVDFGNSSILGLSVFPGDPTPLRFHGFICDYRAFGRGAPYLFSSYNKGRTTTHELGHFFNLNHIWGDDDGACTGSDFPDDPADDDTPNQGDATQDNPDPLGIGIVRTDNCSPNPPGIMYQNFMDYTHDSAMALFTKGQQTRMDVSLSTSPDRAPLLSSTAYQTAPSLTNDANLRLITYPSLALCNPTFTPRIILRNSGGTALTSLTIFSIVDNAAAVATNWTGNLAPYTETEITLSSLNGQPGTNSLTIYSTSPNGAADERKMNDTLRASFEIYGVNELTTRVEENFSNPQFPPAQWRINNPDGDLTWSRNATIGKNAPGSAWFNDFNNQTFHRFDDLVMPNYSYNNADSIFLYFNLAAATSSDASNSLDMDTLTILVTKDCGNSFTTLYKKWGDELQTVSDATFPTEEFFPTASQWRRDSVNLGAVLGNSEAQFQVYFRISGNFENNVFLDDVVLETERVPEVLKEQGYLIYPTAAQTQVFIWHYQQPTDLTSIIIYNAAGQRVWLKQYRGNAEKIISVNLQGQPAGVYFIRMNYADGRKNITSRIVKQ